jgi:hypothetical protein
LPDVPYDVPHLHYARADKKANKRPGIFTGESHLKRIVVSALLALLFVVAPKVEAAFSSSSAGFSPQQAQRGQSVEAAATIFSDQAISNANIRIVAVSGGAYYAFPIVQQNIPASQAVSLRSSIVLPADAPTGSYNLAVVVYSADWNQRLWDGWTSASLQVSATGQAAAVPTSPPAAPGPPAPTAAATMAASCSEVGANVFFGCYYDDVSFQNLALTRTDAAINFDWGNGSPGSGLDSETFSVVWKGNFGFSAGNYKFTAVADDGVRVYVDNQLILDGWADQPPTTYEATVPVAEGTHLVTMEYYEFYGGAVAKLSFAPTGASTSAAPPAAAPSPPAAGPSQAPAPTSLDESWPRIGAAAFGGSPREYCSDSAVQWMSRMSVVFVGIWDGYQKTCGARSWGQTIQAVKDQSPLPSQPKIFGYFDPTTARAVCCDVDDEQFQAATRNNWWLRQYFPWSGIVANPWAYNQGFVNLYFPGGSVDGQGRTVWNWLAQQYIDIYKSGGSYGTTNGGNSPSSIDGLFQDNLLAQSFEAGDFDRNGSIDNNYDPAFVSGWRQGQIRIMEDAKAYWPGGGMLTAANLSKFQDSRVNRDVYSGYFDAGFLENMVGIEFASETWGGLDATARAYQLQWDLLRSNGPKLGIFGVHVHADGSDDYDSTPWRAAYHDTAAGWILGDGYVYLNIGSALYGDPYSIANRSWLDYYSVDGFGRPTGVANATATSLKWLGTAAGPGAKLGNGVWRRAFSNGVCFVNPKNNGTRNISVADIPGGANTHRRIAGTQRPSIDNGAVVGSDLSLNAREGICLQRL